VRDALLRCGYRLATESKFPTPGRIRKKLLPITDPGADRCYTGDGFHSSAEESPGRAVLECALRHFSAVKALASG
jgi:hypothetical protein